MLEANLRACAPGSPALARFTELAALLTGRAGAEPLDGVRWIQALVAEFQLPGLGRYGLDAADLDRVAGHGLAASSMKANPVPLSRDELAAILAKAL